MVDAAESRLRPGVHLDRYELLAPVASGGMGAVWLAVMSGKHGFEKLVAIKTIHPDLASDDRYRAMMLDEARIASGVHHPNVAQILDFGESEGVLYLVMEWVDGDSLSRLCRVVADADLTMPLGVALRIVAETAAGLHAAHELRDKDGQPTGVVHRDVSPQNILVCGNGAIKLIDFGIAKAEGRTAEETTTGQVKGKVSYMAPEQALGDPLDARTDVWGLGAVLYFLLAGKPPYASDNAVVTLAQLATGRPPSPLPAWVPASVVRVVDAALTHDPKARIATAAKLQKRIEECMATEGCVTTTTEVGAFVEEHLAERAKKRAAAIERALADNRAKGTSLDDGSDRPLLTPSEGALRASGAQRAQSLEHSVEREAIGGTADGTSSQLSQVEKTGRRTIPITLLVGFLCAAVAAGAATISFTFRREPAPTKASPAAQPEGDRAPASSSPSVPSIASAPALAPSSTAAPGVDASVAPASSVSARPPSGKTPRRPTGSGARTPSTSAAPASSWGF